MASSLKDKNSEIISKRWAHALMELVCEDESISKDTVLENLKIITDTFSSSPELSETIANPSVSTEEKQVVLCKLFQNRLIPVVYNFLFALNLKKRANLISDITNEFVKELNEINNIKHVEIVSAIDLDENKKNEIKNRISSKLHKELIVDWKIDSDIIAGLIMNVDETVIDNSIRHRLEDINKNICK